MNYLPQDTVKLINWLKNFSKSIEEIGQDIGIGNAEILYIQTLTKIVRDDMVIKKIDFLNNIPNSESLLNSIKSVVKRVRKHPNYIPSIHGIKLKIV